VSTIRFSLAFEFLVERSFNNLGQNTTAHDRALEYLLAWFSILIMGSAVDLNRHGSDPEDTKRFYRSCLKRFAD
jgi:hypothetical protein